MFLLVPAYPGCPGQTAVKWLLLLLLFKKNEKVDFLGAQCGFICVANNDSINVCYCMRTCVIVASALSFWKVWR